MAHWSTTCPVPEHFEPLALRDVLKRQKSGAKPLRVTIDKFPVYADDPLRDAHLTLEDYLREAGPLAYDAKPKALASGQAILESSPQARAEVLRAILVRGLFFWTHGIRPAKSKEFGEVWYYDDDGSRMALPPLSAALRRGKDLEVSDEALLEWADAVMIEGQPGSDAWGYLPIRGLVDAAQHRAQSGGLSPEITAALTTLRDWHRGERMSFTRETKKLREDLDDLLGKTPAGRKLPVDGGEPWADAVLQKLGGGNAWESLLAHCATSAGSSKPTGKWLKEAKGLIVGVGAAEFSSCAGEWLTLAVRPRAVPLREDQLSMPWRAQYDIYSDRNEPVLKGLAWACGASGDARLAGPLGALAEACYKKIPNVGPRSPVVGNACLIALIALPGQPPRAELSRLKAKVKQPTACKMIEKALGASAAAAGMTPDDLEEMAVGTYGLSEVGRGTRKIAAFTVECRITGTTKVGLTFTDVKGKSRSSVPAELKGDVAVKELEQQCKELSKMLPALRDRLERMPMNRRELPYAAWRARFLDHPVAGSLARRLIWEFAAPTAQAETKEKGKAKAKKTPGASAHSVPRVGIYRDGKLVDATGKTLNDMKESVVRLWHPIDSPAADVLAWRQFLQRHEVAQPFKQAYREVYLLTDAERKTRTYSNRFAGHVLRQNQLAALCTQRGWKYRLIGSWDGGGDTTPRIELKRWGLRAEYWLDHGELGDGDEAFGGGVARYVAADQVRFYEGDAEKPMPLERVPALPFSEVMRDVDLFVGVASVGNDPTWVPERGPAGERVSPYWHAYSFGDLSATAETRRAVLEHLIPRLKIRDRATLTDRFLVVKGKRRTYKIHLGSSNILMEPNDQYLCIVPGRSTKSESADGVFLPFEGDQTLSVILSKAFLLVEDDKITDETITRQIGG